MNECNEIWAVYEQTAAQPPQYQPTNNDKKAMQLNAAAQKPQVAPQVNVQVTPQPQTIVRAQPQMTAAPAPSVVSQDEQQAQQEQEELDQEMQETDATNTASTIAQDFEQAPVATTLNTALNATDVPAQASAAGAIISGKRPAAAVAKGFTKPVAAAAKGIGKFAKPATAAAKGLGKFLGPVATMADPLLTTISYSQDPEAFNQQLNAKNARDMQLYDQGKTGEWAANAAYDGFVNPTETILRAGKTAGQTAGSMWDAAKSWLGANQGSALSPAARQKAKASGMLADNFNILVDYLQHQLDK